MEDAGEELVPNRFDESVTPDSIEHPPLNRLAGEMHGAWRSEDSESWVVRSDGASTDDVVYYRLENEEMKEIARSLGIGDAFNVDTTVQIGWPDNADGWWMYVEDVDGEVVWTYVDPTGYV